MSSDDEICTFVIDRIPNHYFDRIEEKEIVITDDEEITEIVVLKSNDIFDIIPPDVLARIFSGWLSVIDISSLDVAISGKCKRSTFLSCIKGAVFDGSERAYYDDYISWLNSRNISVKKLKVNNFDNHSACILTAVDKNWSNLVWLDVQNGKFSILSIIKTIKSLGGLTYLNLKGCRMTDAVVLIIATNLPKLKTLNLKGCSRISNDSFFAIGLNCTQLKSLNLSFCSKLTGFNTSSFCLPDLEELELAGCINLTNNDLHTMIRESNGLRKLNLRYCQNISFIGLRLIIMRCKNLESIDLPFVDTTLSDLTALIDSCKKLKKLNCPPILNFSYVEKLRELYPNIETNRYNSNKSCPG
jgi:hypothetical protein